MCINVFSCRLQNMFTQFNAGRFDDKSGVEAWITGVGSNPIDREHNLDVNQEMQRWIHITSKNAHFKFSTNY